MLEFRSICVIFSIFSPLFALPDDVQKCEMSDEKCLLESANFVLKNYYGGISDINLVSIDPMMVEKSRVVQRTGPVTVDGVSTNVSVTGYSKGKIEKIGGFDKDKLEIKVRVPHLNFKGKYKSVAEVLGISINGAGPFTVNFYDFEASVILNFTKVQRDDGRKYFNLVSTWVDFDMADGDIDVPDLGYIINLFVNASFRIIKNALTPVVREVVAVTFNEKFGNLFTKTPLDELFIERNKH